MLKARRYGAIHLVIMKKLTLSNKHQMGDMYLGDTIENIKKLGLLQMHFL